MLVKYLNPRYDIIFKMLLENKEFAKELISIIIGREVIELIPEPQEKTLFFVKLLNLVIYRKDFRARIKTINQQGSETIEMVKIEMQKSSIAPHIDRFREYIGSEYATPYKTVVDPKSGKTRKFYLPIIPIFFVEKTFNQLLPAVLGVDKNYFDVLNNRKKYTGKPDKYVELLTHEAYFVQLNRLPSHLKGKFEILRLFMGEIVKGEEETIMQIEVKKETYFNSIFGRALFELANKIGDSETVLQMREERKFLQTYQDNFNQLEIIEQNKQKLEQNKQELEQKDQQIEKKDQQIEKKDQQIEHKDQLIKQNKKTLLESVKLMTKLGATPEQIQDSTGLTKQEIENLYYALGILK